MEKKGVFFLEEFGEAGQDAIKGGSIGEGK